MNEDVKRWDVLLRRMAEPQPFATHHSAEPSPEDAIREALRKLVPYAHDFAPAVPGVATYDQKGDALHHPSVKDGWLVIAIRSEAGLELPDCIGVRLQGHHMRETSIEQVDDTDFDA